jgi:hypothetical protein
MLAKNYSDAEPQTTVDGDRLAALSSIPADRFGLAEDERKAVYNAWVASEDRATHDAAARVPESQIKKQLALQSRLREQYEHGVLKKYHLTKDQLVEIGVEAYKKGWPSQH